MLTAKHAGALFVAAALASGVAAQAAPKYQYKVKVLVPFTPRQGSGAATLINNHGLICGVLTPGPNPGFCLSHGQMTQLVPLAGDTAATPLGLNDKGQVVGVSSGENGIRHAVIFVNGAAQPLPVNSYPYSEAFDINNHGQIVGYLSDVEGESQAYVITHGSVHLLGTLGGPRRIGFATSINDCDCGQIVGAVSQPNTPPEPGDTVAFLYQNGVMRALPTPAGHGSLAASINARGQIVGRTELYNGGQEGIRAVLWYKGSIKKLLDRPANAIAINNKGQVIGGFNTAPFGGFLYEPGKGARDLKDLVDPAAGFTLIGPQAINDRGEIVGLACKENLCGPVLLEPVQHGHTEDDNQ